MPVQFVCAQCRQVLSVGRKKIGVGVPCPRCGASNIVPDEATGAAAVAALRATRGDPQSMMELVVYDDDFGAPPPATASYPPSAIHAPGHASAAIGSAPPVGTTSPWIAANPAAPASPTWNRASGSTLPLGRPMLLVSRKVVYAQAVLFVLVGVVTFFAGYLLGLNSGTPQRRAAMVHEDVRPVTVHGTARYAKDKPDRGAVVIVLPTDEYPPNKLNAVGFRPTDPQDEIASAAARALNALRGDCVRVGDDGEFTFVTRGTGPFYVLIISANSTRGRDVNIARSDLDRLAPYFESVPELISNNRYQLRTVEIVESPAPIVQVFE